MDLMSWLRLMIALGGAGVAAYGVWILITGRAPRGDQRAFRRRTLGLSLTVDHGC